MGWKHYAIFRPCNRHTCVLIFVTKWCIVGYWSDALWDVWDGSIRIDNVLPMDSRLYPFIVNTRPYYDRQLLAQSKSKSIHSKSGLKASHCLYCKLKKEYHLTALCHIGVGKPGHRWVYTHRHYPANVLTSLFILCQDHVLTTASTKWIRQSS